MKLIPLLAQCFYEIMWVADMGARQCVVDRDRRFLLLIGKDSILSFDVQQQIEEDTELNAFDA